LILAIADIEFWKPAETKVREQTNKMCTVTFMPRGGGYCLAMNRDEKLARAQGLPPTLKVVENRRIICPSEPGGGTWIALNDSGVSLALINWYSIPSRVQDFPVTRGEVVNCTIGAKKPKSVEALLRRLPLNRFNPFRLIGIFPAYSEISEWRWDVEILERKVHAWEPRQWISSGLDEPAAERERSRTFEQALGQMSVGSLKWLRRLHRSHAPKIGPFSTCMHRTDAVTVSYTETSVYARHATLRHCPGPPCRRQPSAVLCLPLL
jgi:transport and Golgi organization protein 2